MTLASELEVKIMLRFFVLQLMSKMSDEWPFLYSFTGTGLIVYRESIDKLKQELITFIGSIYCFPYPKNSVFPSSCHKKAIHSKFDNPYNILSIAFDFLRQHQPIQLAVAFLDKFSLLSDVLLTLRRT